MIIRVLFKATLALSCLLFLFSCQKSLKDPGFLKYYYPLEDLREGLVYEYHPVNNDSLPVNYWYFRVHTVDGSDFLTGNNYDANFEVQQFVREKVEWEGVELVDFILYRTLPDGKQEKIDVEIVKNEIFPSYTLDSLKNYTMKLKWDLPKEEGTFMTIEREKKYYAKSEYPFDGKNLECVVFELKEHIEHFIEDDGYLEPEYPGIEIYAKGIGLVYYKKVLGVGVEVEYKLERKYSMEEFEKLYDKSLD